MKDDERLRRLLRRGDPLSEERGVAPAEWARMRRIVVEAEPSQRHRAWILVPAAATVGLAILALFFLRMEPEIPSAPAHPRAHAPAPPSRAIAALPPSPVADPRPAPRPAPRTQVPTPRSIRFVTNQGTQIIWTLDPNFRRFKS